MPDLRLGKLLRDLKDGKDVSRNLRDIWSPSSKRPLSKTDSLALAQAVAKAAESLNTRVSLLSWHEAIVEFRRLAVFLKPAKSSDPMETIASIEKYSLNYALRACQDEIDDPSLAPTASVVAAETLRLLFESRNVPFQAQTPKKTPRSSRQSRKENLAPTVMANGNCDGLIFSNLNLIEVDKFLPHEENATVSSVITGAITIRVAAKCESMSLLARTELARNLGIPWASHLSDCSGSELSLKRRSDALVGKMKNGLLIAAKDSNNHPLHVLRTRAFAVTLCDPSVEEYAYNVLRVVNSFLRRPGRQALSKKSDHEHVAQVYREAVSILQKSEISPTEWTNEDVSSLLDHIISTAAQCEALGIDSSKTVPKHALSSLLHQRSSSLSTTSLVACESEVHACQMRMFDMGLYSLYAQHTPPSWGEKNTTGLGTMTMAMNESLTKLSPVDKKFRKGPSTSPSPTNIFCQKASLRLLRILEPYRRDVCNECPELKLDLISILQLYVSVLTTSLTKKRSCGCCYAKTERLSTAEVALRLSKMMGAGIEAIEKLLTFYIENGDNEGLNATIHFADHIFSHSANSSSSWTVWIARKVYETCFRAFSMSQEPSSRVQLQSLGKLLLSGVGWLSVDEPAHLPDENNHFPDVVNMLCLTIDCYIACGDVSEALYIAARKLLRSFCFETSCLAEGILPVRVRSKLLRICGKSARLALANKCVDDFLTEFSPDDAISENVRRRIGLHFFHALGEYSMILKSGESSLFSLSFVLRDIVKVQNEILFHLHLSGKCSALQTYQEWTSILLDGISSGISSSPRLLADTTTVLLSNGEKLDVDLGPRYCTCSICSDESFFLLHILKGAWRAALHRSPFLLKQELNKLDRFLASSNLQSIHTNLKIVTLDFFEWCQAFAVLTSIEDPGGVISNGIQICKQTLDIKSARHDVVKIYGSHGFLAARPFYSHLLHSGRHEENSASHKDGRWSLLEEEKFMFEGSRADFFVQNLNLKSAVDSAKKSLRSLLVKIMALKYDACRPVFSVGGVEFEVQIDIITAADRTRALQMVELIIAMERLGIINMKMENFNDGLYFLEKAASLSKTLCGTDSVLHRRQRSVVYQGNLLILKSQEDIDEFLKSELREADLRSGTNFDKTLISNSYAVIADIAIAAVPSCDARDKKAKEFGSIAHRLSTSALDILSLEGSHETEEPVDDALITSLMSEDVNLRSGQAQLLLGNFEEAASLFDHIRRSVHESRLDLYVTSILGLIRALIAKVGGISEMRRLINEQSTKTLRTPRTRRAARKSPNNDNISHLKNVLDLVKEVTQCLEGTSWEPQIRTEAYLLHSSLYGPNHAMSGLAWEIGNGFGLQWEMRKEHVKPPVIELDPEEDLVEGVNNLCLSSRKERDLEKCHSLLDDSKIIVIGMSLDELNDGIIFWRISATGIFSTRLALPVTGKTSYRGISDRVKAIFDGMKGNAVKPGDSFTEDQKESWWETTYDLDEAMKMILEDIERDWFGSCNVMLLPACSSPTDEIPSDAASQAISALLTIEECYGDEVSRSTSKTVFESLGFGRASFQKTAQYILSLDCEEGQVGNTVFVLDPRLEHLPFESLPILRRNNVGSTRMPSLHYLIGQLSAVQHRPNPSNVFYLLNPGGDLPRTEKKFRAVFEKRKGWHGVAGVISADADIPSEMKSADIFVFCGHGGAEKYVSPRQMTSRENAPIAVLMGCSSAKLFRRCGYRGSSGTPLDYLIHGAPAVVGNLWDVTDKDIDRLTASFLKEWLGVSSSRRRTQGIAKSLAIAREACRLPHLVGAATVIYGLPFV